MVAVAEAFAGRRARALSLDVRSRARGAGAFDRIGRRRRREKKVIESRVKPRRVCFATPYDYYYSHSRLLTRTLSQLSRLWLCITLKNNVYCPASRVVCTPASVGLPLHEMCLLLNFCARVRVNHSRVFPCTVLPTLLQHYCTAIVQCTTPPQSHTTNQSFKGPHKTTHGQRRSHILIAPPQGAAHPASRSDAGCYGGL